jgi:hypothetical protein
MLESVLFMIGYIKKSNLQSSQVGDTFFAHPLVEVFETTITALLDKYRTDYAEVHRRFTRDLGRVNRALDRLDEEDVQSPELEEQ